jgi:hypothetical protein
LRGTPSGGSDQAGENRIEVLAGNGYSEGRATVRVSYGGAASAKPDAYIHAVGVSAYEDPAISSLKYSGRDAQGVVAAFKAQEGKRYGRVNALAEGGLAPTAENIRNSLAFLEKAGPKDTIVLFISGHGVSDERGRFYFLPKDAAFQPDGTLRRGRSWCLSISAIPKGLRASGCARGTAMTWLTASRTRGEYGDFTLAE